MKVERGEMIQARGENKVGKRNTFRSITRAQQRHNLKQQHTHTWQDTKYLLYKQISLKQYFIIN